MEFSRVTSGFAMRVHRCSHLAPAPRRRLRRAHRHRGPQRRPTTARVAGRHNGYGNVVQIKHSNQRSTLYAHLSRIDVRQGQRSSRASTSARSAPPAGPPARTCISIPRRPAATRTRCGSPRRRKRCRWTPARWAVRHLVQNVRVKLEWRKRWPASATSRIAGAPDGRPVDRGHVGHLARRVEQCGRGRRRRRKLQSLADSHVAFDAELAPTDGAEQPRRQR